MIIYVLTSGRYSDYSIDAVYTNKEMAEEVAKINNWRVEEYESDQGINYFQRGYRSHNITMTRNGDVVKHYITFPSDLENHNNWTYHYAIVVSTDPYETSDGFIFRILTDSEERAIKIANEIRTQILAMGVLETNKWGTW